MATSDAEVTLYVEWDNDDEQVPPPKYYKVPRILYEDNWANNSGYDAIAEYLTEATGLLVRDWYLYSIEGVLP